MSDDQKKTVTARCANCGEEVKDVSDLLGKILYLKKEVDRLLDRQHRHWYLGGSKYMSVVIPNGLTRKNIERIRRYIDALEAEASIAWEDDDSGGSK